MSFATSAQSWAEQVGEHADDSRNEITILVERMILEEFEQQRQLSTGDG